MRSVSGQNLYVRGGYYTNVVGSFASTLLARTRTDLPPPRAPASACIKPGGTGTQTLITFTAEPGTAFELLSSRNLALWEVKSTLYAAGRTNSIWIDNTRPREFLRLRQLP